MKTKPILCAGRLRHVPRQFSWVDQRLVRDGHIRGRTTAALAFYLFLCTVADAQGSSYYSDGRVCELLGLDCAGLMAARRELVEAGLVAYRHPFYQVLSLEAHKVDIGPSPAAAALVPPGLGRPGQAGCSGELRSIAELMSSMMEGRP